MKNPREDAICGAVWFLALSTISALWSGDPRRITFVAIIFLGIFIINGKSSVRSLVSLVMIPLIMGITAAVAWKAGNKYDEFNWLFSKTMFIIFFGTFGIQLAELLKWKHRDVLALLLGGLAIVATYQLKFFVPQEKGEIISVAVDVYRAICFPIRQEILKEAYSPNDWYEDILLGVAVIMYAVVIPKALKTSSDESKSD